ncbi:hypothetical protein [Desertivirga arenae]|uniref:hypothetical protein n=1 Tax=Desertivirga arenae TaxID=2810309 RepID=UPI001A9697F1|nr:hypothetical protein [Pedobacter sp. SYSU D00823]
MDIELSSENLIQHLINWFNLNPKTEILDRNKREAIVLRGEWIEIHVDYINTSYGGYFKQSLFMQNAELLSKKLVEVVKEWMKDNGVPVMHLKLKIMKQGAQFPRQGLIRV